MAEIDRLEVQVEAQATKANSELDKLVGKLNRVATSLASVNGRGLTGLANGVQKFIEASAGLTNVKTADFTSLAKNIQGISSLNTSQMYSTASAMGTIAKAMNSMGTVSANSVQIADMAKNIAKLGGVNVQRAITNLPQLEEALSNFINTMSKAPVVSKNVIQMTNSLAELASQGNKVGTAANTVSNAMNAQAKSAERATKSNKGLSSALGSIYQKYFWVARGVGKAWDSLESSMDYIETYNYFSVTLDKIGAEFGDSFADYGRRSAENYVESFKTRLNRLAEQMTGFSVADDGVLSVANTKNLSLNPQQIMNYQASVAAITNSVGLIGENSINAAKALSMLSADMSSLKNIDMSTVMTNFQSGLIGQSRALYKYGIDITNATLQTYAYEQGITKALSVMTQSEKMQLRLLAILDQSKVAWGDMANTLNSVANQYRISQQQFANLSRIIGNLFIPIAQKALPVINGLAISLQRLLMWGGELVGIDWSGLMDGISTGYHSDALEDLADSIYDTASGFDGAADSAKKLKSQLMGFDELNVITTSQNTGAENVSGGSVDLSGAISGALADYESIWKKALENSDNLAEKFADKFEKYLEPVKKILKDFAIGDFFQAGKDTSALVAGIFNFFANAIDDVNWYKIGQNMGDFLAGIDWIKILSSVGHLLWEALKASFELYAGMFSAAPIETALLSMVAMPKLLKVITAGKIVSGVKNLWKNFKILSEKAELSAGALFGNDAAASGLAMLYPDLGKKIDNVKNIFSDFSSSVSQNGFWRTVDGKITTIRNNMSLLQKGVIGAAAVFGEFVLVKDAFYDLASGSDNVTESLLKIVGGAGAASAALYVAFGPAGIAVAAVTGVVAAITGINKAIEEAQLETMFDSVKESGTVAVEALQISFEDAVMNIIGYADTTKEKLISISDSKESIEQTADSIGLIVEAVENGAYELKDKVPLVIEQFNNLLTETKGVFEEEYDVIVGNVMGAYADILEAQGKSVPEIVQGLAALRDETIAAYSDLEEQAKSLEEQYNSGAISADEFWSQYTPIIQKIHDFNGNKELDNATSALENFYGALDISKYIDGTEFNLSSFSADMEQFSELAEVGKNSIALFGEESAKNLEDMIKKVESVGGNADKYSEDILAIYGANDDYVAKNTQAIEKAYQEYMNIMQQDLLEQLPAAVEEATKDYEKLNPLEKIFTTKSDYVQGVVDKWKDNILVPSTNTIQSGLSKLGLDGSTWAEEEANKITDALFTSYVSGVSAGFVKHENILRSDWRSFIDKSMTEMPEVSKTYGQNVGDGYIEGINEEAGGVTKATCDMVIRGMEAAKVAQDSHSPSKEYAKLGKYAVEGYAEGISNNAGITEKAIREWMQKSQRAVESSVMNLSSDSSNVTLKFGESTVIGYNRGIENKVSTTVSAVQSWMTKAKNAITTSAMLFSGSYSRTAIIFGQNTALGYNSGVSGKASTTNTTMRNWMNAARNAIINSAMSFVGGQSAAAKLFGENTVLGYNGGVSSKQNSTIHLMDSYMQSIYNTFGGMYSSFYGIGGNAMSGLQNGLNSRRGALINTAQDIADSITRTIQSALQIHSPSRVMFELGTYTTEGFLNGIESMFPKVEANMGDFTRVTEGLYNFDASSHQPQVTSFSDQYYEIMQSDAGMEENNMLLRELIQAVRQGAVITVDGRELGRTVQKEAREYYNRTGKPFVTV